MRIGFITTVFDENRGGSGVFANLFRRMCRNHSITIIARQVVASPAWQAVEVSSSSSHTLLWYTERQFARSAVRRIRELHREQPFDVIIVNQVIGPAIADLRSLGVPVAYVIHHPVSVDIELALQESPHILERLRWHLAYGNMAVVQRKLAQTLDTVVTVSESTRRRIAKDYAVSLGKIIVIPNGIDTDFFKRTRPAEPKTVIAVGSYQHPRRGFRYLIQAYRRLAQEGYRILDVGRRTVEQDAMLRAIPGLEPLELVPADTLPDLYSQASVAISTSLYEGFGLAIIEALACETPCIAFAAGGVVDVLGGIDSRLLCPIGDVEELVAKVLALQGLTDGARYRQGIVNSFGMAAMERRYEDFLSQLVR